MDDNLFGGYSKETIDDLPSDIFRGNSIDDVINKLDDLEVRLDTLKQEQQNIIQGGTVAVIIIIILLIAIGTHVKAL